MKLQRIDFDHSRSDRWIGYWWVPDYWAGQLKVLTVYLLRWQFSVTLDFREGDLSDWLRPKKSPPNGEVK